MKTKILLVFLLGILATTGSTCINDGFLVAVNLPISACFNIKSGSNLSWTPSDPGQPVIIKLSDAIDGSYVDKIKNARYYDMQVTVHGAYAGSVSGFAYINGKPLLSFQGQWSDFATPQSLIGSSTHITPQTAGVAELVAMLNQFKTNASTSMSLTSNGSLSGQSPVPSGLSFCFEILAQVDAQVQ